MLTLLLIIKSSLGMLSFLKLYSFVMSWVGKKWNVVFIYTQILQAVEPFMILWSERKSVFFFFFFFFLSVFWSYCLFLGKLIIPPYLCSLPIIITLNLSFCLAHARLSGHFKSTYLLFWSHLLLHAYKVKCSQSL